MQLIKSLAFLAAATSVSASISAADMSSDLKSISDMWSAFEERITEITNGQELLEKSPAGVGELNHIVSATEAQTHALAGTQFSSDEQDEVCEAYSSWISTQRSALKTLTGSAKLFQSSRYTTPYAVSMRRAQGVDDTFAFAMLDRLSECMQEAQSQKTALDATFNDALSAFTAF